MRGGVVAAACRGGHRGCGASWTPAALTPAWWHSADSGAYADAGAAFASASSQELSRASNSSLNVAGVDFWLSCWFRLASSKSYHSLFGKFSGGPDGYYFYVGDTGTRLRFRVNGDVANEAVKTVSLSLGTWYHAFAWRDHVNGTLNVCLDGGAAASQAYATAVVNNATFPMTLGNVGTSSTYCLDGGMDSACLGKSPPGGIAALATTIRDRLYNSGSGLRYSGLTSAEKTAWGLVSWYDFASSGAGLTADSHGTNTLTNTNGVTLGAGVPQGLATADGDPVSSWRDQSGNARHLLQATYSKRPTLKLAVAPSGLNCLDFDGVDDYLRASFTLAQPVTVFLAGYLRAVGASGANDIVLDSSAGATMAFESYDTPQTQLYAGTSLTASGAAMSAWAQVTLKFNGGTSLVRVNGSDVASGNAGSATPGGLTLAALGGGSGSRFTQLRIGEIFGVSGDVTGASLTAAEAYLRTKWGTP